MLNAEKEVFFPAVPFMDAGICLTSNNEVAQITIYISKQINSLMLISAYSYVPIDKANADEQQVTFTSPFMPPVYAICYPLL